MVVGPSPVPSRYVVRIGGVPHFVRCAADILLTGLQGDIEGEGRCPVCDATVRLRMRGGRVVELEPESARVHVVERRKGGRTFVVCEPTHLFDRETCLEAWRSGYGEGGTAETPQAFVDRWAPRGSP